METQNSKTKECNCINIFYKEDGISIIELLESDFSDFVTRFIKEKIK